MSRGVTIPRATHKAPSCGRMGGVEVKLKFKSGLCLKMSYTQTQNTPQKYVASEPLGTPNLEMTKAFHGLLTRWY